MTPAAYDVVSDVMNAAMNRMRIPGWFVTEHKFLFKNSTYYWDLIVPHATIRYEWEKYQLMQAMHEDPDNFDYYQAIPLRS